MFKSINFSCGSICNHFWRLQLMKISMKNQSLKIFIYGLLFIVTLNVTNFEKFITNCRKIKIEWFQVLKKSLWIKFWGKIVSKLIDLKFELNFLWKYYCSFGHFWILLYSCLTLERHNFLCNTPILMNYHSFWS